MTEMGIKHFSHQHKLFPFETLEIDEFYIRNMICKGCEESISIPFHGCKSCQFYIHDECLNTPRWLKHPSHPSHTLVLLPYATYSSAGFGCDACGYHGNAFDLTCAECEFDLHPHCANSPATICLDAHPHELKLMYANPDYHGNTTFNCNVCGETASHKNWLYYCSPCGFHAHLRCAKSGKHFGWVTTNDLIPKNEKHDDSTLHTGSVVHNKQQQQNQSMIDHQAPSQPTSGSPASTSAASATNAANKILIKEAANAVMEAQAVIVKSQMDQMRMLTKMLDQPLQKILLLAEAINPP